MGLCSGHGNSVVIRELSLYPQSLLAKLTVVHVHSYLVYPGGPGPGTARNFEMSVTPNHTHVEWIVDAEFLQK